MISAHLFLNVIHQYLNRILFNTAMEELRTSVTHGQYNSYMAKPLVKGDNCNMSAKWFLFYAKHISALFMTLTPNLNTNTEMTQRNLNKIKCKRMKVFMNQARKVL